MARTPARTFVCLASRLLLPLVALPLVAAEAESSALTQITTALVRNDQSRQDSLPSYAATRRYTFLNHRLNQEAAMVVRTRVERGERRFEVVDRTGSEGVYRRVFQKLLEAETEASRQGNRDDVRLSPRNYEFRLLGTEQRDGRLCHVLAMKPKRSSKFLLEGKVWIDAEEFAPVRVEGRPSASVSFWVGKPYIVQEYAKVDGHWLITQHRCLSDTRLLGKSELTIQHSSYELTVAGGSAAMPRVRASRALALSR